MRKNEWERGAGSGSKQFEEAAVAEAAAAVTDFNIPTSFLPSSHLCGRCRRSPGEINRKSRLLETILSGRKEGLLCSGTERERETVVSVVCVT